jgi:DNA-binding MarR family transcriptional regulator
MPSRRVQVDNGDLGLVLEFIRMLWEVDHGLMRVSKRMQRDLGVTGPQRFAIRILGQRGGIGPGELARFMHLHPGTVTGVVRRLERLRLVRRVSDPSDGRRQRLHLTPAGRRLDQVRTGTIEACVRAALARATPARLATARDVLAGIAEALRR